MVKLTSAPSFPATFLGVRLQRVTRVRRTEELLEASFLPGSATSWADAPLTASTREKGTQLTREVKDSSKPAQPTRRVACVGERWWWLSVVEGSDQWVTLEALQKGTKVE